MTELKTKIVEFRREQNITQGDLADRVGVRRETIVRLERGQYNPSLKLLSCLTQKVSMDVRAKVATLFALKNTESVINKQPKRLSDQVRRNQKTLFAPRICLRVLAPTTVHGQSR